MIHDALYLLIRQHLNLTALGYILPNQAIGVLIQSTLPGTVWIGKIYLYSQCVGDCFMACELFAVVNGYPACPIGKSLARRS